jgi:hypothetical protein
MVKFLRQAKVIVSIVETQGPNAFQSYRQKFEINDLRISFNITKSLGWATNRGVLKVWNLSQDRRNAINFYGDQIEIWAGYAKDAGLQKIYSGQTSAVYHAYDQPEVVSTFECGDGERIFNNIIGSFSFAAGTTAQTILETMAKSIGLSIVEFAAADNLVYPYGFKNTGPVREAIVKVCAKLNLQAIIENGDLYILPIKGVVPGLFFEVNENTGMQSIPERFAYRRQLEFTAVQAPTSGYKVNSVLLPSVRPGSQVNLSSTHLDILNEPHRVETVRHFGDTWGPEWVSNLELTAIA